MLLGWYIAILYKHNSRFLHKFGKLIAWKNVSVSAFPYAEDVSRYQLFWIGCILAKFIYLKLSIICIASIAQKFKMV